VLHIFIMAGKEMPAIAPLAIILADSGKPF